MRGRTHHPRRAGRGRGRRRPCPPARRRRRLDRGRPAGAKSRARRRSPSSRPATAPSSAAARWSSRSTSKTSSSPRAISAANRSSARAASASASTGSPTASTRPSCRKPKKAPIGNGRLVGASFDYPHFAGPNGVLGARIGSSGSYSPATRPEIFYNELRPGFYRARRHPGRQRRLDDARSTPSPTSGSCAARATRCPPAPAARSPAPRPRQLRIGPCGGQYFTLYSQVDADLPPPDGFPAPLPPPALGLARLRLAGDGDDGPDPLADRARGQRDRGRRQARPAAAGAGDRRRRDPAPRPDRRPPPGRRQGLARGRIRPAPALLRPPAAARARLLRRPADRAADVAGDRRPAVDPLLPRLRADLHHPEPADDRPGQRR